MSAIKDVIINIIDGVINATGVNFGVPLLIGYTGSRSIVKWGSGSSGIIAKSVARNQTFQLNVSYAASYSYAIVGGVIEIETPNTARVRDLIADFIANAPPAVTNLISLEATGTGSGIVQTLSTTTSAYLEYQRVESLTQIQYYYDSTDTEWKIIANILGSSPSPNVCYLLNTHNVTPANIANAILLRDNGDWFAVLTTSTDEADQQAIADYVNNTDRIALFVSSDANRLDNVKGDHIAYIIHDAQNDHPEASWAAKCLPSVPTVGWKFQSRLQGQTPNLTASLSDLLTVRSKKGNSYVRANGVDYVDGSQINTTSGNLYLDNVIGRLWIKLNLQIDIQNLLLRAAAEGAKIPYTDQGINQIVSVVANRLTAAGQLGLIAPVETQPQAKVSSDGQYRFKVTALSRAQVEVMYPTDITNRVYKGIKFAYVESGAIERAEVTGVILLSEV